ncbi:MAG TPA: gluconate 2-dehydrogenase subunit 3 family protein [Gemmatimonadales bacterium]|nr:gluconate 2-dehydrogenase subunit 3 family protein [Gemmatimonadales bacterium]
MNRRDLLGVLGAAVASPVLWGRSADDVRALGRELHRRAAEAPLRILDRRQSELVATIAELIIPATDTPGARAAKVHEFMDLIVAEWYTAEERQRFLAGLAGLDARGFLSLRQPQQAAVLSGLDAEVTKLRESGGDAHKHFFHQIKWLTVYGYYTSEIGVKLELKEEVIPGRYDPCVATGIPSRGGP